MTLALDDIASDLVPSLRLPGYAIGDAMDILPTLPAQAFQMCVTSVPYWNVRSYLPDGHPDKDREIGLEYRPEEWVEALVAIFREVRRCLRDDGTVWLNVGDRYVTRANGPKVGATSALSSTWQHVAYRQAHSGRSRIRPSELGLKHKDLMLLPARLALALQADGWIVRSDIIWQKASCVPESVRDRPTNDYEHVFLLAKSQRYYYDWFAIREECTGNAHPRGSGVNPKADIARGGDAGDVRANRSWSSSVRHVVEYRNRRAVWSLPTQPYHGDHHATYPPGLIRPMILAGTSPTACGVCGAPWERLLEREEPPAVSPARQRLALAQNERTRGAMYAGGTEASTLGVDGAVQYRAVGWAPSCEHDDASGRCAVLDPFLGSGTTGMVAEELGRTWFGVELNPEYEPLIRERTAQVGLGL